MKGKKTNCSSSKKVALLVGIATFSMLPKSMGWFTSSNNNNNSNLTRRRLIQKSMQDIALTVTAGGAQAAQAVEGTTTMEKATSTSTSTSTATSTATDIRRRAGILWHSAKQQAFPAVPKTVQALIHHEMMPKAAAQTGADLTSSGIVCISERHDDFQHHLVQLKCIQSLNAALKSETDASRLSVGMECFQRQAQPFLDRFIADPAYSINDLKRDSRWDTTWGYDMLHMVPILTFAKQKGIRLFGLHPTDEMVAAVETCGVKSVNPSVLKGVCVNQPNHYQQFQKIMKFDNLSACADKNQHFQRQYEVQCFREEYMAESVSLEMNRQQQPGQWMVVLAGENHIVGRGGIPFRALRRSVSRSMQQEGKTTTNASTTTTCNRGVFTIMPKTVQFPVAANEAPDRLAADYVWFVERPSDFDVNKVNAAPVRV